MKARTSSTVISICYELDECATDDTNDCVANAECTNNQGSYECDCNQGYELVNDNCIFFCDHKFNILLSITDKLDKNHFLLLIIYKNLQSST